MVKVIKTLIFLLSNLGYWELFRRKTKIHPCFFPSLTIALQISSLIAGGFLNILYETAIFLLILGLLLLLKAVKTDKNLRFLKNYICPAYIILALCMGIMLWYVKGKHFVGSDNFSHWALVVKIMLKTNHFPNFTDKIIIFETYPLGSSSYIYYFSKFVHDSEPFQMLAQILMLVTSILPIFFYAKKNKAITVLIIVLFTTLVFAYNTPVYDLTVDTLLPLVSMCGLFYIFQYCTVKKENAAFFLSAAYMIEMIHIKNSGILFLVIGVIWILFHAKRKGSLSERLLVSGIPLFSFYLWQKHYQYVFPLANLSYHAMSIQNYKRNLDLKSPEFIHEILTSYKELLLNFKDIWLIFLFFAVLGILTLILFREKTKVWAILFFVSLIIFITYVVGEACMYLFSMPSSEAEDLPSIYRYTRTILIMILYLETLYCVYLIGNTDAKKPAAIILSLFTIGFIVYFAKLTHISYKYNPSILADRLWLENAKRDFEVPNEETYCILTMENNGYLEVFGRYLFESRDVISKYYITK